MKPALGKGLSALIPDKKGPPEREILNLPVKSIVPNENQPRRVFSDNALNDLVASVKEKGVIQPVIVRKTARDIYQLIAGERRWRAAQIANLETIPAIIKDVAQSETLELALIENIQREDLNPVETAEAFQKLISEFKLTHDDLSKRVGKDRATITNYIRILKLPQDIRKSIASGLLSLGHAKALLQLDDRRAQLELAHRIITRGLSVRETEKLCRKDTAKNKSKNVSSGEKDPQIASLEDKLRQSLGTKVRLLHRSNRRGKIEIEYYSLEELDRLLEILIT